MVYCPAMATVCLAPLYKPIDSRGERAGVSCGVIYNIPKK